MPKLDAAALSPMPNFSSSELGSGGDKDSRMSHWRNELRRRLTFPSGHFVLSGVDAANRESEFESIRRAADALGFKVTIVDGDKLRPGQDLKVVLHQAVGEA